MVFTNAFGLPLPGTPPAIPSSGHLRPPPSTWTHPTGERLRSRWVHFQPTPPTTASRLALTVQRLLNNPV